MNSLKQPKLKTITIYTRQQITSYFQQFKQKINLAYDREDLDSINQLLYLINMTIALFEVPHFADELNIVGDIQVTSYLQALYVKNTMWKNSVQEQVKNSTLQLMNLFQALKIGYKMTAKLKQLKFKPIQEHFSFVFERFLDFMYSLKEIASITVAVDFLKVMIIHQIQSKKNSFDFFSTQQSKKLTKEWVNIVKILIKYCRVIQNLKKQETAISICYWLCSTQKSFIPECINEGILNILKRTLSSKNITESYGFKIINFLKLLMNESDNIQSFFSSSDFESSIVKFSQKFDNQKMLKELRELMNVNERKNNLSHKEKLELFRLLSDQPKQNEKELVENIHLIGLYAQSDKISDFIFNSQLNKFENLISSTQNMQIFKQIFSAMAYIFHTQKGTIKPIELILSRLKSFLSSKNEPTLKLLTNDKKKLLINFLRMMKQLLSNKKYLTQVIESIKQNSLERLFTNFSDCTNFVYEKELISFKLMLKSITKEESLQDKLGRQNLIEALQKHLIQQSGQVRKLPGEDQLSQIKLLYELLSHNQDSAQLKINTELVEAISHRTYETIQSVSDEKSLQIFESGQNYKINEIKSQINKFSLLFFNQLFKVNSLMKLLDNEQILVKNVKIGLNTDNEEILDGVIQYVIQYHNNFGIPQSQNQLIYELWKKALEKSHKSQETSFIEVLKYLTRNDKANLSPEKKIKSFIQSLSQKDSISEDLQGYILVLLKSLESSGLKQFLQKLSEIDPSAQNLLSYLNCIYELSRQQSLKALIFKLFSNKMKIFYAQQVQSPKGQKVQKVKNKIYLILSELIEQNISSNSQYFNEFLKITLMKQYNPQITRQSIIWIEEALKFKEITSYENKAQRFDDLFQFVQKNSDMIGIECYFLLQFDDKREAEFLKKHKLRIEEHIEKSIETMNLNFLEKYASFCGNDVFSGCGLITLFDKVLHRLREQLKQLNQDFQKENSSKRFIEGSKIHPFLNVIHKRRIIISGFVCSERIIMNQNESDHTIRQMTKIIETCMKMTNQMTKQPISESNRLSFTQTLKNLLKILIHIFKNCLQFRQLSQNQQKLTSQLINSFVSLNDKQVNEILSELLRLMILKDRERNFYRIQKEETYNIVGSQLAKLNTEKGKEHLAVCKVVLGWGQKVDQIEMNKMIAEYFLLEIQEDTSNQLENLPAKPDSSIRSSKPTLSRSLSDSEIINYLKNLLHPPYTYGLNTISKFLKPIRSQEYVQTLLDVFILSSSLYEEDMQNQYCSLSELRQSMIDTVLEEFCDISERFYIVLGMGKEGASLGLRRKGIGVRGVSIICDRFVENKKSDDVTLYAEVLTLNVNSMQELEVIQTKNLPKIINQLYRAKSIRPQYCIKLGNLIGQSSKLQEIQQLYSVNKYLVENLSSFKKNHECIAATLNAIAGVAYCNAGNQKELGTVDTLKLILSYSTAEDSHELIIEKGFNALANVVIKNKPVLRAYFDLQIERKALKTLQTLIIQQKSTPLCIKQILRLLGIIALTSQGGFKLINLRYIDVVRQLTQLFIQQRKYEIVKLVVDVLFNITNQTENDNRVTIQKMHDQKAVEFLVSTGRQCPLYAPIVESCLESLENLLSYDFILQTSITPSFLQFLQQISQTQQNSESVFMKWFRLLYLIFKHENKIIEIALSNILYFASNYIRAIVSIDSKILQINMNLILKLKDKLKPNELARCGWIEFLIENLKLTNQPSSNLSQILDILLQLTDKNLLSSFMCTKLFQILIKRLQLEYKDENARTLIILLKKIKEKTSISSETAIFLLEFSCFFLTQKDIILSPRYHRRVREIISILAFFITFNIELKIIFRNPNLVSILKDWIKIDTLIEEETSIGESCRLCLFAIFNDQNPLTLMRSVDVLRQSLARDELQKGCKCTLYRRDGSSKSATIKLIKEKNEIVAFKHPKGQIKPKYVIPLDSILSFRSEYEEEDDILYEDSVFPKDSGIFSKKAKSELLLTVMGMVGEELSIRSINVEFSKIEVKNTFVEHLKLIVTAYMNKRLKY